jgi:hypothetical protein
MEDDALAYVESDAFCRGLGKAFGSLGTSLVQIENDSELSVVMGVCRGEM